MHSNLFSHPERFLEDHTSCVIELANRFLAPIDNFSQDFKDLLTIITLSHDIGKSTKFFQEYIRGDKTLRNRQETKHALLGAIVSLHLANKHLSENNLFLLSLSFVLPKRHHSNLKNFLSEFFLDDNELEILQKQIASIDKQKFQIFLQNIKNCDKKLADFTFDEIDFNTIKTLLTRIRRFIRKLKDEKSLDYYIDTVLFFSLLLDADKSDVGIQTDKKILFQKISLQPDIVDNFIQTFKPGNSIITQLRREAYEEVSRQKIDINQKIYTLTLPTGLGKTLISFKTALKIADEVKKQKGDDLKIIYCLPFLSIIEQNFQVFEEVLRKNGIKPDSATLLKHHHLSGFAYKKQEEFDYDTSRILIEGWNAKIVVTTFLQFFYSLIGNKNRMLRKFHKFANAVIILDEVQSIPHKYWLLLREVLTQMARKFNFYIIFTTATQPMIFEKHFELASQSYFEKLNRYDVNVDKKAKTLIDFFDDLKINDKSHLFILNTVGSAKKLYEIVKNGYEVTFLSTHIVPKERIKRIQELKQHKKQVAISTQLIEAGVDIDFDIVYRDFAPFDSLNQSAGRCNREGKKNRGNFHIIKLIDDNGRLYGSYIYDSVLLNATDEILTNSTYTEQEFIQLINSYFHKIMQIKSDKISLDLLEMLYSLKFSAPKEPSQINSIEDFILIKEDSYKQDVFIEIDDEAKEVWKTYINIWEIEDLFEKKKAFDAIKAKFYKFVVSVPIQENTPPILNNFYYVSFDSLADYYNLETGFIPKREYYVY